MNLSVDTQSVKNRVPFSGEIPGPVFMKDLKVPLTISPMTHCAKGKTTNWIYVYIVIRCNTTHF